MADGEGGGGGGEGEGGESSECLPMDDLEEAMVRNSQTLAEALAADRARREAADRIQRESWEAALKEKDAEIDRLRAEAAEANKKLQADASRKMRWKTAHELLLGANQKLAELRDADMEDSRTCAETPNSKEVESCTKLSQNTVNHTASDFRKLKHDYETLSSKKDKEFSALLSEKDSLSDQLSIMQNDYANTKVEVAQATQAALKLQQGVDGLKVLAQKKDDEIGKFQAEAVEAKMNLQKMHSLVKEKYDEIQRLKVWHPQTVLRHIKDSNETHKISKSDDTAIAKDGQDEASQKRRRVSSVSNSPRGAPRPHEQLPSVSPSASAAAGLIKPNEAEQQPKREQRFPERQCHFRGRVRGRGLLRRPVVGPQSCDQAEIGGQIEVAEEENSNSRRRSRMSAEWHDLVSNSHQRQRRTA